MKEERINPNFNINAKYESMIEEANKIIKVYLETTNLYEEDGRYNLAYDVKNYLPKLLEENKSLQSQLKAKEEVIKEAREYIKKHIRIDDEYPAYMEMLITERDELDEILSKGENDEILK